MNDHELDAMLDRWKVPPMRDSLREDLRVAFSAAPKPAKRAIRIGRLAVVTACAAAVLFGIVQVSPRTVRMASSGFRIPFYVEFEFARYRDDGSTPHRTRLTSFPYGGNEIAMAVTESGDSILDAIRGIAGAIRTQFVLAMPALVLPKQPPMTEPAWFADFVRSGCSTGKTVVGHEDLAGYETTVVESGSPGHRLRIWMAPGLECFALKITDEVQEPNGTYRLKLRKAAIKVTMNP